MNQPRYAVIDTETTGFSRDTSNVIEVAVVLLDEDMAPTGQEWSTLIDHGLVWVPGLHVHGITSTMLGGGMKPRAAMSQFHDMCRGLVWVAHNAAFDVSMLDAEAGRVGLPSHELVTVGVIDTLDLARRRLPGLPAKKLGALATYLRVPPTGRAHRALSDARQTAAVLRHLSVIPDPEPTLI